MPFCKNTTPDLKDTLQIVALKMSSRSSKYSVGRFRILGGGGHGLEYWGGGGL